jgi:hypothetical protein
MRVPFIRRESFVWRWSIWWPFRKGPLMLHSIASPSTTAGRTRIGGTWGTEVKCIQRALGSSPKTLRVAPFFAVPIGFTFKGRRSFLA